MRERQAQFGELRVDLAGPGWPDLREQIEVLVAYLAAGDVPQSPT